MRLRYESSGPCVVRAAFTVLDSDEAVESIIGRDLLTDGLKGPAGEGDTRICPVIDNGPRDVYIFLSLPAGTALLQASGRDVRAFLHETEELVPRGAETGHVDLDASLVQLLGDG
ncbi:SsgA family sporulation/cell division regulator [Streptomyces sp. NPDC050743]|uniref:SsgA family sporulation/cell division regulator n=1 Tax=Streptomyces sp. NPDC050743 TaxID=3365634 RepID=UPI00378EEA0E